MTISVQLNPLSTNRPHHLTQLAQPADRTQQLILTTPNLIATRVTMKWLKDLVSPVVLLFLDTLEFLVVVTIVSFLIWLISRGESHQRREEWDRQLRQQSKERERQRQLRLARLLGTQKDIQRQNLRQQLLLRPRQTQTLQPQTEDVSRGEIRSSPSRHPKYDAALCENCQIFFRPRRQDPSQTAFPHSESLRVLRQNAMNGCAVCALISRQLKNRPVEDDQPVRLPISHWGISWHLFSPDIDIQIIPLTEVTSKNTALSIYQAELNFQVTLLIVGDHITPLEVWNWMQESLDKTSDSDMRKCLARHWHSDCKANHAQCRLHHASNSRKWRPTRLISFTESPGRGTDVVRLADGASLPEDAEYVALSHCWGTVHPTRLLGSTEADLRAGYPISQLPKTFREAIQVCRWLDYRYIWIDSLCIFQDSADDWQNESKMMKLVYGQGALTIAAANASDSTKGLFTERDPNNIIPPIVPCNWHNALGGATLPCCVIDMHLRTDNIEHSNLAKRGWTVQQCVLSPRLLSFGKTQMFYQCLEDEFCESFPLAVPSYMKPIKMLQLHDMHVEPQKAWCNIVNAYSTAELTKDSDKLMAIAGVAEAMQERLCDRYVAGLWEANLLTELLWSASEAHKPRPNPCIAPTWSWLSTNSTVSVTTNTNPRHIRKHLATVVSTDIDLVDPSYGTGNIHPGATIQLRGRLKSAEWDLVAGYGAEDFRRYQVTCDGCYESRQSLTDGLPLIRMERPRLWTQVDACPGLHLTSLDIRLLPIAIFAGDYGGPDHVEGLILTPKDAAAGIYERVAHFRASDTIAAYLFLEKLSGNQHQRAWQTSTGRRKVLGSRCRVEGFAFKGTQRWTKIEERDIVIV